MNREQFQQRLDSLGSDLKQWPAAERSDAEQLLLDCYEAVEQLQQAKELDRQLGDSMAITPASASLKARLSQIPDLHQQPAQSTEEWIPSLRWIWELGSLAAVASVAGGLVLGANGLFTPSDVGIDLVSLAYGDFLIGGLMP